MTTGAPREEPPRSNGSRTSDASPRSLRDPANPRFGFSSTRGQPNELAVQAKIRGQLRVKAKGEDAVLSHRDRVIFVGRDHLHVSGPLDERRANEDAGEVLSVHAVDVQGRLKAVHLTAVAVAPDSDIEQPES